MLNYEKENQTMIDQGTQDILKEGTCCLCGGRFEHYGNNPWSLADGAETSGAVSAV